MNALTTLLLSVLVLFNSTALAAVIDFEDFKLGGQSSLDVSSPLLFNNVSGEGINVTIVQGSRLRVSDLFVLYHDPLATGQALSDYADGAPNPIGTTITFDVAVAKFSLRAGDFGGDDETLSITAYDANGQVVGTSSILWNTDQQPPFATLNVTAPGISSIVYRSGGAFPGSTFIDDLAFTPVPEPSAASIIALTGLATVAYGISRRRRTKDR